MPPLISTLGNPPSPQRQRLQLKCSRFNISPESKHPDNHTDDIHNIIPIRRDIAKTTSLDTSVLLSRHGTIKGACDERALEAGGELEVRGWGDAGGDCEEVDEFEDEETGECTA